MLPFFYLFSNGVLMLCHTILTFNDLKKKALESTVGKEDDAGKQHFLLFPQCFPTLSQSEIVILAMFNLSSANAFNLVMSKNLFFGKGLKSCRFKISIKIVYFLVTG